MSIHEAKIICPECKTSIKLTESLAAPLLEATRRDYERRLSQKDEEMQKREVGLQEKAEALAKDRQSLQEQLDRQLQQERVKIAAQEAEKARRALSVDLEEKAKTIVGLEDLLAQREAKLGEAQRAQAEWMRKQRELEDAKREMEITIEKRVQDGIATVRDQTRQEVEEQMRLRVVEKEQTIVAMQRQIEELKRKAEQGSQQLQGEVQELELENLLQSKFPQDKIAPVPKGEWGGDVLQGVRGPLGQEYGSILWESKRTKNWSDLWLPKLREDQRHAKAEVAILLSQALPKGVETFDCIDGVWVAHPRVALPMALALRQMLQEVGMARQASEGQQGKMELVYQYLMGPRFRQRVQAIVEAFSSMAEDLAAEKKAILRQWAKRETQIERVMQSTVGLYGDLQGIAGKTLLEIEGLELRSLAAPQEELF